MPQSELKPPGGGGPTPAAQEWRKKYSIDTVRPGVEAVSRASVSRRCLRGLTRLSVRVVLPGFEERRGRVQSDKLCRVRVFSLVLAT